MKNNFTLKDVQVDEDPGTPEDGKKHLENAKLKIPTFDSEKLCEIIVYYRYLNFNKDLAVLSMQELAKRRLEGDSFDFESYIQKSMSQLPALDFSSFDIRNVLTNMVNKKKEK